MKHPNHIKVLFFSHMAGLGGAERSMLELILELQEKNIFSHVVIPSIGPLIEELNKNSIPFDIVDLRWWASVVPNNAKTIKENHTYSFNNLLSFLPKLSLINPDVVYSNTIASPWGAIAAQKLGKPHIWHIREYGYLDHNFIFDIGYENAVKFVDTHSDLLLVNSNSVARHIAKYLTKLKPQTVYNNIVIPKMLLKDRVKPSYTFTDSLKVIVCGIINPGKNQLEAVMAILKMIENNINAELLLLGNTTDEGYYKKIITEIKLHNATRRIHILGFTKNPYPYIQASDVVLVPSKKEAYGRTVVEGMLLKKVAVATKGGGIGEIMHHKVNGFLYSVGNIKELSKILISLTDKKTREKISQHAYRNISNFNSKAGYGYKIACFIKSILKTQKNTNNPKEI